MHTTLARFDPLADRPQQLSDSHYREVHVRLAAELLGAVPTIRQYSTYLVRRQLDATGHWHKHPTAWRFASQIIDSTPDGQASSVFPEDVRRRLAQDHRNCLRHLRRFEVEDELLHDSLAEQLTTQRYFLEFERAPETSHRSTREEFQAICETLAALAHGFPGLRRMVRRGVTTEAEAGPLDDEGQILTGRQLETSTMVGYLDIAFDSPYAAEPLFARDDVRAALRSDLFATVEGYEVQEVVGFDKRASH